MRIWLLAAAFVADFSFASESRSQGETQPTENGKLQPFGHAIGDPLREDAVLKDGWLTAQSRQGEWHVTVQGTVQDGVCDISALYSETASRMRSESEAETPTGFIQWLDSASRVYDAVEARLDLKYTTDEDFSHALVERGAGHMEWGDKVRAWTVEKDGVAGVVRLLMNDTVTVTYYASDCTREMRQPRAVENIDL